MTESALYPQIMQAFSRGPTRVFRQQSGLFWTGQIISHTRERIVLANPRAVKVGTPGLSDLGGLTSVLITPEYVGQSVGVYLAIEGKFGKGRVTTEQAAFIETVRALGGRAGIARSVEEAGRIISGEIT